MRQFFVPTQDSTILSNQPNQNTGVDEILSVGKSSPQTGSIRSLIQFDINTITNLINNGNIPIAVSFDLQLYIANASLLNIHQEVDVFMISTSWDEGVGYIYQNVTQTLNGATWISNRTGSVWSNQGGDYISSSIATSSISTYPGPMDITFDVTFEVLQWISGSVPNNGFILKFPDSDENDFSNQGSVQIFSKDTHTIYRPLLIAKWDDSQFVTGSVCNGLAGPAPTDNLIAIPFGLHDKYRVGETAKVNIVAREQYPLKQFDTVYTAWQGNSYLPTSSYFSIVDEQANLTIVPFDEYSKISTGPSGSYFFFRVENMYPRRYYKVLIRVDNGGAVQVFDNSNIFTVR